VYVPAVVRNILRLRSGEVRPVTELCVGMREEISIRPVTVSRSGLLGWRIAASAQLTVA
jgi:hypothetical protein